MRLRAATLLGVAVAAVGTWVVAGAAGAVPTQRHTTMQALETGVLAQINSTRRARGLVGLRLSPALNAAARQHSVEMAKDGYFAHTSANGGSFDRRIVRYYPSTNRRFWSVGENLLWSSPDVDAPTALQMWMNSPEQRANLLTALWRGSGLSSAQLAFAPGRDGVRAGTNR